MTLSTSEVVAAYHMDETSGTTVTDSHASYDGTNSGASVNQTGKLDQAYLFDTITDEVTLPSFTFRSVSMWIKVVSLDTDRYYVLDGRTGIANGYIYIEPTTGKLIYGSAWSSLYLDNTSVSSNTETISTGVWYHIAGILSANGTDNVTLGAKNDGTGGAQYEYMDEVVFFNVALSSTQVGELYNSGSGIAYPFASNVTVSPSALSLSTTNQSPSYVFDVPVSDLSSSFSFPAPLVVGVDPSFTGGRGTSAIRTEYPLTEGLILGHTKIDGKDASLVPEDGTLVSIRDRVGLDL